MKKLQLQLLAFFLANPMDMENYYVISYDHKCINLQGRYNYELLLNNINQLIVLNYKDFKIEPSNGNIYLMASKNGITIKTILT